MLKNVRGKISNGMCLDGAGWGQVITSMDVAGIIVTKSVVSDNLSHRSDVKFTIDGE